MPFIFGNSHDEPQGETAVFPLKHSSFSANNKRKRPIKQNTSTVKPIKKLAKKDNDLKISHTMIEKLNNAETDIKAIAVDDDIIAAIQTKGHISSSEKTIVKKEESLVSLLDYS